jgi:prophage regulatory protein
MTERIHRLPEVKVLTGLSRSTIYAQMAEGTFPKPKRIGKRAVGWTDSIITEWQERPERHRAAEAGEKDREPVKNTGMADFNIP